MKGDIVAKRREKFLIDVEAENEEDVGSMEDLDGED